ncbi:nitrate- and nitrite sensing domain-containing protein [Nonomuraea antimicrobica]
MLLLVPLLSLVGLWAFAASLTGGQGMRLLSMNDLATNLADPSEQVNIQLQNERLASVELLVTTRGANKLAGQRERTDRAVTKLRTLSGNLRDLSPELIAQLNGLHVKLDELAELRRDVDDARAEPLDVIERYSQIVDASFRMYDTMVLVPDMALYQQARAVTMLGEAKDVLSRERALIAIVLAKGRVEDAERESFTGMVATRRLLFSQAMSHLDDSLRGPYAQMAASPVYMEFLEAEELVRGQAAANGLPVGAATWPIDGQNLWAAVERNQALAVRGITERVMPTAIGMLVKLGVAGGVGLVVVVASILLSLRFRRRLVRELAGLRDAATELAEVRLAALVKRLRSNTAPPTAAEVAPLEVKVETSEVHDIVRAFNDVQSTAVEAAVSQARLRHGVSQVFVNLARRNQSLLHRQLLQLDSMERATEEPGSWRTCSSSTTSPRACAGTPKASSSCRTRPRAAPGATRCRSSTCCAPPWPRWRSTTGWKCSRRPRSRSWARR